MSINNDPPENDKCQLCTNHRGLTGSGVLTPLTARAPVNQKGNEVLYIRWICEDCVALFNTNNWGRTRKALKALRYAGIGRGLRVRQ